MKLRTRNSQSGMTLIELMIAMVVLAVGMAGVMILLTTAIATNSRNKSDTTGTMLAQMVLEKIAAFPANQAGMLQVRDCRPAALGGPQTFFISTLPGGLALLPDGNINWTVAQAGVPANYGMIFFACGANGQAAPYDVRWNVQVISSLPGPPVVIYTKLVTVSSRPSGAFGARDARAFAPPVTLRTIAGM